MIWFNIVIGVKEWLIQLQNLEITEKEEIMQKQKMKLKVVI